MSSFRSALLRKVAQARRTGIISGQQAFAIRINSLRKDVEDQLQFEILGAALETGVMTQEQVEAAEIDWDKLFETIEKIVELILLIMEKFN